MNYSYERIAADLAEGIVDGTYAPGTALPTVRELAEQYGVNPKTTAAAVGELQTRGLVYSGQLDGKRANIVRNRGRTSFYATDALRADVRTERGRDAFRENAQRAGRTASTKFRMRIEQPPADIARRLRIGPHDLAVVRISYQLLDDEPWSRETGYYPRDLAEEVGLDVPHDIEEGTIRVLERAGYADKAHRDELADEPATPEDAMDLGVPVGSPLLVQTRTVAADTRITRVTRTVRLPGRVRMIWEHGDSKAIDLIRDALDSEAER